MSTTTYREISFSDDDIINLSDYIPAGEYNPRNIHPILIHEQGFVIAVVFAEHGQEALDLAAEAGWLNDWNISDSALPDYGPDEEGIDRLGKKGEPFDLSNLDVLDLPNPPMSFVTVFQAAQKGA